MAVIRKEFMYLLLVRELEARYCKLRWTGGHSILMSALCQDHPVPYFRRDRRVQEAEPKLDYLSNMGTLSHQSINQSINNQHLFHQSHQSTCTSSLITHRNITQIPSISQQRRTLYRTPATSVSARIMPFFE